LRQLRGGSQRPLVHGQGAWQWTGQLFFPAAGFCLSTVAIVWLFADRWARALLVTAASFLLGFLFRQLVAVHVQVL